MHSDESLRALVAIAASRHNTFTSSEAAEQLVSAQRLRRLDLRGEVRRLHPRVWAFCALPNGPRQSLLGSNLSLANTCATTTSAAWLHGWLNLPPIPQLWTSATYSRNHPVADLRRWARIEPKRDITVVDHIPTLSKAATLCSLGPYVDELTLERCLDEFLRTESVRWLERVVAKLVALPWLPPIVLQHPVTVDGRSYRIDTACPELMLGIEAHSRSFHSGRGKEDADNVRDLHLGTAGWEVLYVTHAQTKDPEAFIELFSKIAATRAEQLGLRLSKAG